MQLKTTKKEEGQRLDLFLAKKLPDLSRSASKKHIENGCVLVGGKKVKASYQLNDQDVVSVDLPETVPQQDLAPENIRLDIVYEDDDLVIINKPAGMVVHPDNNYQSGTLVNALLNYYPPIKDVGESDRPGIVHRLDKDTSGLIICAKTEEAYKYLVAKFKAREVTKKYYALVFGKVKDKQGTVTYSLSKNKSGTAKMTIAIDKEAVTKYKVEKYYQDNDQLYTLLEVSPQTGRTHQIRIHLAKIGHPIVGDQLYSFKQHRRECPLKRQFLHAFRLEFKLPSEKDKSFEIGLPEDLNNFLPKSSPVRFHLYKH
ncbi:MAG: RluA family pseudouridine synthase [Parcubacteria group bacterium]|nr:RluA family pseudouridine synthase [Parcubacteria group bacterium]